MDLRDARWSELQSWEGEDIPALIRELEVHPEAPVDYEGSPLQRLWISLHHQGDIANAAFAVVPHLVRIAAATGAPIFHDFVGLPATVEAIRGTGGCSDPPEYLAAEYRDAISRLPAIVAQQSPPTWTHEEARAFTAGLLVAKEQFRLALALLFMTDALLDQLLSDEGVEPDQAS